jgi:hypothetical protein
MPSNSPWKKFYINDFVETGIKLSMDVADDNFWLTNLGGLKVSGSYEMNIETHELRNLDLTWIAWDGIDCNPDSTNIAWYATETVVMWVGDGIMNAEYDVTIRIPERVPGEVNPIDYM